MDSSRCGRADGIKSSPIKVNSSVNSFDLVVDWSDSIVQARRVIFYNYNRILVWDSSYGVSSAGSWVYFRSSVFQRSDQAVVVSWISRASSHFILQYPKYQIFIIVVFRCASVQTLCWSFSRSCIKLTSSMIEYCDQWSSGTSGVDDMFGRGVMQGPEWSEWSLAESAYYCCCFGSINSKVIQLCSPMLISSFLLSLLLAPCPSRSMTVPRSTRSSLCSLSSEAFTCSSRWSQRQCQQSRSSRGRMQANRWALVRLGQLRIIPLVVRSTFSWSQFQGQALFSSWSSQWRRSSNCLLIGSSRRIWTVQTSIISSARTGLMSQVSRGCTSSWTAGSSEAEALRAASSVFFLHECCNQWSTQSVNYGSKVSRFWFGI